MVDFKHHSSEGLVSVIIPTYNRSQLLAQSVESIFQQDYRPIEVIIVDDGSTDDTKNICDSLSKKAETLNISLFYIFQNNAGVAVSRNTGLKKSHGEFIQFLDSDDILHPQKIQIHADFLKHDKSVDYVFSNRINFINIPVLKSIFAFDSPTRIPSRDLFCSFRLMPDAGLYRKSLCDEVGDWNPDLTLGEDIEYSLRMLLVTSNVCYINLDLSFCRQHEYARLTTQDNLNVSFSKRLKMCFYLRNQINRCPSLDKKLLSTNICTLYFKLFTDAIYFGNRKLVWDNIINLFYLHISTARKIQLIMIVLLSFFPLSFSKYIIDKKGLKP
jgi:glycosyltransferase involved in cell wall biosynthesis